MLFAIKGIIDNCHIQESSYQKMQEIIFHASVRMLQHLKFGL